MNRKITGTIIIIITVLLILFIKLNIKNYKYNDLVNKENFNNIISTHKKTKNTLVETISFNKNELLYDSKNNKWYYSIVESSKNKYNPVISYKSSKKVKILILDKITTKKIESNKEIKFIVYTKNEYYISSFVITTLPIMNIDYDKEITRKNINMNIYLFDNNGKSTNRVTKSEGKIHLRGASSSLFLKKSYRFSLTISSIGNNKRKNKISLLDMRQDDDYLLYPAYNDQEKIRNVFASNLWYESCSKNNSFNVSNGMQYKYVELFLNNEYNGLYALGYPIDGFSLELSDDEYMFKKINWAKSEINVLENNSNTMGGYELQNKLKDKNIAFSELKNYYKTMLTSKDKKELYQIADIDNVIDTYLFINFVQGVDNLGEKAIKNMYITLKKKDNKYVALYAPWDLDITLGNKWRGLAKNQTDIYINTPDQNLNITMNPIYYLRELNDEKIDKLIIKRYKKLRNSYWSEESITKMLNEYENDIYNSGAFLRDQNKWPDGNYNEVEEKLNKFKDYVLERLKYMDLYIEELKK